ncbi:hypothetical protein Tco_0838913 [Tanacetum coccineum]|uniref:Uncharacterized protein n=1 Tax=Tanacetum coccineum TaxID=301880 RepID=A0ABQ5AQ78_9ASTR
MNRSTIRNGGKKQHKGYYGFNTKFKLVYMSVSKISSPNKHTEAGKGNNATMNSSNSNGGAKPNEASTSKSGNMVKTSNAFDVLNSLEVDPTTYEEPSNSKDSTQRAGTNEGSCIGNKSLYKQWKETMDDDDDE